VFEEILVPVDGSELSERAIPYATAIAKALGDPVQLLQVAHLPTFFIYQPPIRPSDFQAMFDTELEGAHANLERLRLGFAAAGVPATAHTELGDPAAHIIDRSRVPVNTLIVMATHGRGGLARWVLGSVAEKVLRWGESPVFLVPAFVEKSPPIRRILVPLDGSELAASVLTPVAELAGRLGAQVCLFRAFLPEVASAAQAEREVCEYLENVKSTLAAGDLEIEAVARRGEPAAVIVDFAAEQVFDLIAMATHGRGAIGRWAFGSVADKVLHAVPAPVLLFRARPKD
jgi:nucleotide-binding universal stress UspA family protein